VDSSKESIQFI